MYFITFTLLLVLGSEFELSAVYFFHLSVQKNSFINVYSG